MGTKWARCPKRKRPNLSKGASLLVGKSHQNKSLKRPLIMRRIINSITYTVKNTVCYLFSFYISEINFPKDKYYQHVCF